MIGSVKMKTDKDLQTLERRVSTPRPGRMKVGREHMAMLRKIMRLLFGLNAMLLADVLFVRFPPSGRDRYG